MGRQAIMGRQTVDQYAASAVPVLTGGRSAVRPSFPSAGLPRRSRDELLAAARHGLDEASLARVPAERYSLAHLAALRAAAAVLADRAQARPGHRGRPASAWRLLVAVAPELAEWAQFFAAGAARRAAAEAGLPVVGTREADDLVRQVEIFLGVVRTTLGLPSQPVLPAMVTGSSRLSHGQSRR